MRRTVHPSKAAALALAASMFAIAPAANAFNFGVHVFTDTSARACMSYDGQVVGIYRTLYTQAGASPIVRPELFALTVTCLNDNGTIFGGSFQGGGSGLVGIIDRGPGNNTQFGSSYQGIHTSIDLISDDGSVGISNTITNGGYTYSRMVRGNGTLVNDPQPGGVGSMFGTDLSRNGQFAVVDAQLAAGGSVAYRHHAGVGYELISLPGAINTSAHCISADGSVVAGSYDGNPYIWANGVFSNVVFDGSRYSGCYTYDMNDDASVLVGVIHRIGASRSVGGISLEDQGWVVAQDYFASLGILMPQGRTILTVEHVSSDGTTFLGTFDNNQHFVVKVPAPSSLALLALAALASRRRRC